MLITKNLKNGFRLRQLRIFDLRHKLLHVPWYELYFGTNTNNSNGLSSGNTTNNQNQNDIRNRKNVFGAQIFDPNSRKSQYYNPKRTFTNAHFESTQENATDSAQAQLFTAIEKRNSSDVINAINNGANVNAPDKYDNPPFVCCITKRIY